MACLQHRHLVRGGRPPVAGPFVQWERADPFGGNRLGVCLISDRPNLPRVSERYPLASANIAHVQSAAATSRVPYGMQRAHLHAARQGMLLPSLTQVSAQNHARLRNCRSLRATMVRLRQSTSEAYGRRGENLNNRTPQTTVDCLSAATSSMERAHRSRAIGGEMPRSRPRCGAPLRALQNELFRVSISGPRIDWVTPSSEVTAHASPSGSTYVKRKDSWHNKINLTGELVSRLAASCVRTFWNLSRISPTSFWNDRASFVEVTRSTSFPKRTSTAAVGTTDGLQSIFGFGCFVCFFLCFVCFFLSTLPVEGVKAAIQQL